MGAIVLTSCVSVCVCVFVRLAIPAARKDVFTFCHGGQVDLCLGQVRRSSSKEVKVMRSKNFHWDVPLTSESLAFGCNSLS